MDIFTRKKKKKKHGVNVSTAKEAFFFLPIFHSGGSKYNGSKFERTRKARKHTRTHTRTQSARTHTHLMMMFHHKNCRQHCLMRFRHFFSTGEKLNRKTLEHFFFFLLKNSFRLRLRKPRHSSAPPSGRMTWRHPEFPRCLLSPELK